MARPRSCDKPFRWPPIERPPCLRQLDHKPKPQKPAPFQDPRNRLKFDEAGVCIGFDYPKKETSE